MRILLRRRNMRSYGNLCMRIMIKCISFDVNKCVQHGHEHHNICIKTKSKRRHSDIQATSKRHTSDIKAKAIKTTSKRYTSEAQATSRRHQSHIMHTRSMGWSRPNGRLSGLVARTAHVSNRPKIQTVQTRLYIYIYIYKNGRARGAAGGRRHVGLCCVLR